MLTKTNRQILEVFFRYPTRKFYVRELSRITGLSAPTVSKSVNELVKGNLLKRKKNRAIDEISANFESEKFRLAKMFNNLKKLYETGLIDCLNEVFSHPKAIIVFGSYRNGEDIEKSDVDIAVISEKNINVNLIKFEKRIGRKINIHILTNKELKKLIRSKSEFMNSLVNGFIIEGYLEVL